MYFYKIREFLLWLRLDFGKTLRVKLIQCQIGTILPQWRLTFGFGCDKALSDCFCGFFGLLFVHFFSFNFQLLNALFIRDQLIVSVSCLIILKLCRVILILKIWVMNLVWVLRWWFETPTRLFFNFFDDGLLQHF